MRFNLDPHPDETISYNSVTLAKYTMIFYLYVNTSGGYDIIYEDFLLLL